MIKKGFYRENTGFITICILFLLFAILGAFINKLDITYIESLSKQIEGILNYYEGDVRLAETLVANLKEDVRYLCTITACSLLFLPFIASLAVFFIKAISIGYTINTSILLLKSKSIKICFLILIKNIVVIPTAVILMLLSIEYVKNIYKELKKRNQESILVLGKRYLYYAIILIVVGVFLQLLFNIIGISILKFLSQ